MKRTKKNEAFNSHFAVGFLLPRLVCSLIPLQASMSTPSLLGSPYQGRGNKHLAPHEQISNHTAALLTTTICNRTVNSFIGQFVPIWANGRQSNESNACSYFSAAGISGEAKPD